MRNIKWLLALALLGGSVALLPGHVLAVANLAPSASFTYSPSVPTVGQLVTFTSTSRDPDGRIALYEWDLDGDNLFGELGEPVGPTTTTAARSFASPGSYVVRLRVTDDTGVKAVASRTVSVVKTTAPQTRLTYAVAGPVRADGAALPLDGKTVPLNIATFAFAADAPSTFKCALDRQQPVSCGSARRYVRLPAGPHRFAVYATDAAGKRDPTPEVRGWTIGPVNAQVTAQPRRLKIRGPKRLSPRRLLKHRKRSRLPRARGAKLPPGKAPEDDEYDEIPKADEPGDSDCGPASCEPSYAKAPTPAPTTGPFAAGAVGGNDPQIAASSTHLVTTNNGSLSFFDKSGKPATDKNGKQFTNLSAGQFFRPWFDPKDPSNINASLNLPPGLKCDPKVDLFDGDPNVPGDQKRSKAQKDATVDCMQSVYDTRVIYDEFRDRFWVLSAVRNNKGGYFKDLKDPQQRVGIRYFFLVAVSTSPDPRKGWYLYAWSEAVGQWACNDLGPAAAPLPPFCPGSGYRPATQGDYPSIGISKEYFVSAIGNTTLNGLTQSFQEPYVNIGVVDAQGLANGGCSQSCGWQYGHFDAGIVTSSGKVIFSGKPFGEQTRTVVQHGTAPDTSTVLVSNMPQYDMVALISFNPTDGASKPPHVKFVPVGHQPTSVTNLAQRQLGVFTDPMDIRVKNLEAQALKATLRHDKLYVSSQTCVKWEGKYKPCRTAVRLIGLDLDRLLGNGSGPPVFADVTFGRHEPRDPLGAVVDYGNPGVEVNKLDDAVIVYNRSARGRDAYKGLFLEAGYSALFHGQSKVSKGALLKAGSFTYGGNKGQPTDSVLNFDTAGTAVDPYDDVGIWIAHGYVFPLGATGGFDTAIAKIFGKPYPELTAVGTVKNPILRRAGYKLKLKVTNTGDGPAHKSVGRIYAVRKRRATAGVRSAQRRLVLVKRFRLRRLGPGRSKTVKLKLRVPHGYRYLRIQLDAKHKLREYGERNNVIYLRLPKR